MEGRSQGQMSRRCHYIEHGGRGTQSVVLAVNVGAHRESRVRVTKPSRYDSDRNTPQVHEGSAGVSSVVQTQMTHPSTVQKPPPGEAQRLRVHR